MRVSTESLEHGHDVCGAQAAGNSAEGRIGVSLFMCFIHLQEARRTTPLTAPFCGRFSLASE